MIDTTDNIAHSVFQRLLNRARQNKEDFNLILSRYGMERFLYRLSRSPYNEQFILKGASLFLVWLGQNYRVTKDADFLGSGDPDIHRLSNLFKEICSIEPAENDGMIYHPESVKTEAIREDQLYNGVRVTLTGLLKQARIHLQIDIGFGDTIIPPPEEIEFPTLLNAPPPQLKAYSRYTMVAEKLEIMVLLGLANSRMKDFYDVRLLSQLFNFESEILEQALSSTFNRRGTEIPSNTPVALSAELYDNPQKQTQWKAFIKKSKPNEYEENLATVVTDISRFAMPVFNEIRQPSGKKRIWSISEGWMENF